MIDTIYRDEALLVVHKPAGMLSVPGNNPADGKSLIECLTPDFPDARIVHRLDQATSGIMVVPLGLGALRSIGRQFETRTTDKKYIAVVHGHVGDDDGVIDLPLICDHPNRPLQKICFDRGKPSQTKWRVLARIDKDGSPATIVELIPITGRSHQLRVHMQSMGHPIIGDRFYADAIIAGQSDRLELYAREISFDHPVTGKRMHFHAPTPYDSLL